MFKYFLTILAATSALARPPRTNDRCQASLGGGGFSNVGPFTLAAVNQTREVSQRAGVPLHLSPSVSRNDSEYRSIATNKAYPYIEFPEFRLVDGGLIGVNNASTGVGAAAVDVDAGHALTFQVSHNKLLPDRVFCAVVGTSPAGGNPIYPLLAVEDDVQNFTLCKAHARADGAPLDVVVYKASANVTDEYDHESCYGVYIQLVPTQPY
ncbi:hypothetical protein C8Q77DRAFT_1073774 [Trametes polyzona]|nr:hypothetical protein C8Q77DRAFT_1073774 [Trametes polyzona]